MHVVVERKSRLSRPSGGSGGEVRQLSPKLIISIVGFGFFVRLLFLLGNHNFNYTGFDENLVESENGSSLPSEVYCFKKAIAHDSHEYKALAMNILKYHKFSWDSMPVTFRTPGYPLFIASIYAMFGIKEWIVMLIQVFLSALSIYFIYLIGRKSWGELSCIISAALFSIDCTSILFSSLFMSETLFVFLLLLGTWAFLKQNRFSGLMFGISALIRPIALYLFIPLVFLHRKLKAKIIFLFLFFLPILPWMVRNYIVYQSPMISSLQGFNLLFLNASLLESEETGLDIEEVQAKFSNKLPNSNNPLELASCAQKMGIDRILKSPIRYAYIHLKGSIWMLLATKSDDIILRWWKKDISQSELFMSLHHKSIFLKSIIILFAVLEVSVLIGAIIFASISFVRSAGAFPPPTPTPHSAGENIKKNKCFCSHLLAKYNPNLLFFLIVGYFFICSGGPFGEARYRLPLIPYLYLLATPLVAGFLICIKKR
ncbi:MAG: glycosyltransferase family 39 protein [Candidatus Stahlbacteria bacterium]|nr:glycosyltransferase family 39 protein [Candidatus Stahlbacteria bacterium]